MKTFLPTAAHLFFSKQDPYDLRLGDLFQRSEVENLNTPGYALLGYPDDEGIKLNGGRIGAAQAPAKIREYLYKMTPPFSISEGELSNFKLQLSDLGDINTQPDLASRHQNAKSTALKLHSQKIKPISFGGGHDYGYADAAAFVEHSLQSGYKPTVLNFDAHLDVRPTDKGFNSGTPFRRLLSEYKNIINFVEIGIQPQCNSVEHRTWALEHGAAIFDLSTIENNGGLGYLLHQKLFIELSSSSPVYISFDIDGITSCEGGGCSQAWVTGLKTQDYIQFFQRLNKQVDIRGLGLYEVSPPLDIDSRTSKLAALLAYYFIFQKEL